MLGLLLLEIGNVIYEIADLPIRHLEYLGRANEREEMAWEEPLSKS